MQLVQLILPSLATIALGSAMLAPPRAERDGRRIGQLPRRPPGVDEPESSTFAQLVADLETPIGEATDRRDATPASTIEEVAASNHENSVAETPIESESERVVPLTRRRLRRQATAIDWPGLLDASKSACGPEEREHLLRSIDSLAAGAQRERILLDAVGQEDGVLRLLALRELARDPSPATGNAFAEILVSGVDDERSLAIDVLCALGRRAELAAAFADRVDAIAAKAVLAYVGTRRRSDFAEIFETRLERSQRDAILTLLAGALD